MSLFSGLLRPASEPRWQTAMKVAYPPHSSGFWRVVNPLIDRMEITRCLPKTETEFVFEVSLAEHCDLNCAGCAHFSPLAEPEFADCEETARHFSKYFGESLKESPDDSIDTYQAGSVREIMEFLAKPIPFCRYCMLDKTV